jgi:hypothetical protein
VEEGQKPIKRRKYHGDAGATENQAEGQENRLQSKISPVLDEQTGAIALRRHVSLIAFLPLSKSGLAPNKI